MLGFFQRISLKDIGHWYQLGHPIGEICLNPERTYNDVFTVVDINGIHSVLIRFCNCEHSHGQPHYLQILRFGWFPSTVKFPRMAFTFRLLKMFQILSFESKAMVNEVNETLRRLTDNTGTQKIKVCNLHTLLCGLLLIQLPIGLL